MRPELPVLIKARALIAEPAKWGKGWRHDGRGQETCCASEALIQGNGGAYNPFVFETFRAAAGAEAGIPVWNDAPERTHAEVLAAFDRAIEAAK